MNDERLFIQIKPPVNDLIVNRQLAIFHPNCDLFLQEEVAHFLRPKKPKKKKKFYFIFLNNNKEK